MEEVAYVQHLELPSKLLCRCPAREEEKVVTMPESSECSNCPCAECIHSEEFLALHELAAEYFVLFPVLFSPLPSKDFERGDAFTLGLPILLISAWRDAKSPTYCSVNLTKASSDQDQRAIHINPERPHFLYEYMLPPSSEA